MTRVKFKSKSIGLVKLGDFDKNRCLKRLEMVEGYDEEVDAGEVT